jgi:hypothetical protein
MKKKKDALPVTISVPSAVGTLIPDRILIVIKKDYNGFLKF